jgi:hypothetical protein
MDTAAGNPAAAAVDGWWRSATVAGRVSLVHATGSIQIGRPS